MKCLCAQERTDYKIDGIAPEATIDENILVRPYLVKSPGKSYYIRSQRMLPPLVPCATRQFLWSGGKKKIFKSNTSRRLIQDLNGLFTTYYFAFLAKRPFT